jgi:RNA polymerase sigma-70 factor (ECF subfamily)
MLSLTDSQTSLTLMQMLRDDPSNAVAWDRFVRRYHPKIYGWCRSWGLQEADADDVAQDVLAKLTQKMASFRYDQSRCFRAWLKTITQRVLSDLMASRRRAVGSLALPVLETVEARADLERRIEEIFNRELLDLAILRVRERVAPLTWDAFRLTAFEECTGAQASRLLNMPVASVFVAKHRVQKMLKDEIQKLEGAVEE